MTSAILANDEKSVSQSLKAVKNAAQAELPFVPTFFAGLGLMGAYRQMFRWGNAAQSLALVLARVVLYVLTCYLWYAESLLDYEFSDFFDPKRLFPPQAIELAKTGYVMFVQKLAATKNDADAPQRIGDQSKAVVAGPLVKNPLAKRKAKPLPKANEGSDNAAGAGAPKAKKSPNAKGRGDDLTIVSGESKSHRTPKGDKLADPNNGADGARGKDNENDNAHPSPKDNGIKVKSNDNRMDTEPTETDSSDDSGGESDEEDIADQQARAERARRFLKLRKKNSQI